MKRFAFAGAGFACAVLARQLAESGIAGDVFEERKHIAGNCHTERDESTGILVHRFGPHVFHTSDETVWRWLQPFGDWIPFANRVKATTARGVFSLPLNLLTINQFFGKRFTPSQAEAFLSEIGDRDIGEPKNLEEQALKFIGRELYENFFLGYTRKQWGADPRELPASVLRRLPVRFSYDDRYYDSLHQAVPRAGYTDVIARILDHPLISLHIGTRLEPQEARREYDHVFWSGPLDAWFGHRLGPLQYRGLRFETIRGHGDRQGTPIMNYCEPEIPYTRITEHKHLSPWEPHDKTLCTKEYSVPAGEKDDPFYPLRLPSDRALLKAYADLAREEAGVSFIGRLGTYRYLDMHQVIGESLRFADLIRRACALGERLPVSYRPLV